MKKTALTAGTLIALMFVHQAFAAGVAGLSPVPIWPPDGLIPPLMQNQSVFYNPPAHEVVVSVPSTAGGPRLERRFNLHDGVVPQITTSIVSVGGAFRYSYMVLNAPSAQSSLKSWGLVVPEDPKAQVSHPAWAAAAAQLTQSSHLPSPNGSTLQKIVWRPGTLGAAGAIAPGLSSAAFTVTSAARPGFVTAEFRSTAKTEYDEVSSALPPAVRAQIESLLTPEWDGVAAPAIGPKFQPGTPDSIVAADFAHGIGVMSRRGLVDVKAPFAVGVLQALNTFLASGTPTLRLSGLPLGSASTPKEKEIANALTLAFPN